MPYSENPPQSPDYTQAISALSGAGNEGLSWFRNLMTWAQQKGVDLSKLADAIGGQAGAAAGTQQGVSDKALQDWQRLSTPLYEAQQADALRMYGNLPQYEEEQAGKSAANAAGAVDAQKAAAVRDMERRGIPPSAAATGALDTLAGTQRALVTTAAGEQGRIAARNEARGAAGQALQSEATLPNVGIGVGSMARENRGQQFGLPAAAAQTTAGLYAPGMGMYSASYPYLRSWPDLLTQQYRNQATSYGLGLEAFKANQEADAYGPLSTFGGALLGLGGSYLGSSSGSSLLTSGIKGIGSWLGGMGSSSGGGSSMASFGTGSMGGFTPTAAKGGRMDPSMAIDTVPPSASPSGGRRTDDVRAALSVGEFVVPKRTVDYLGDKFFINLIAKTDKEMGIAPQPVGPEEGPPMAGLNTQPPMFRSEGART